MMLRWICRLLMLCSFVSARLSPPSSLRLERRRLSVRGGATEEESKPNAIVAMLEKLPPGVRTHVVGVAAVTLIAVSGIVDPDATFGLDNALTLMKFQFWRPITSALFLGTPSMGWATSLYLLVKYGQELEAAVGTSAYVKFVILQIILLSITASAFGLPIVAQGLVTAVIYACSRLEPFGDIQFQFGIKLKYYMLPYGLLVVDILQKQSAMAAFPHVLGILCAHFHHFFAVVWPNLNASSNNTPLAPSSRNNNNNNNNKPLAPRSSRKLGA